MHITFFTGAGVARESGIKTFEDPEGLWRGYRVTEVASIDAWYDNPELCLEFYTERRAQSMVAQPNSAHRAIVAVQRANPAYDIHIITQNIDDLHERSGAQNVLNLHGSIQEVLVESDGESEVANYSQALHTCKPNVVMHGENISQLLPAIGIVEQTDLLIVAGLSLADSAVNTLFEYISGTCQVYNIDTAPIQILNTDVTYIQQVASKGVPELMQKLELI